MAVPPEALLDASRLLYQAVAVAGQETHVAFGAGETGFGKTWLAQGGTGDTRRVLDG